MEKLSEFPLNKNITVGKRKQKIDKVYGKI
jgi:hypothetical protein